MAEAVDRRCHKNNGKDEKTENGILEPTTIHNSYRETGATNNNQRDKKDSIVILSDSMLNRLQDDRLSKKYNVKVMVAVLLDAYIHM